jgi:hypothetical protein
LYSPNEQPYQSPQYSSESPNNKNIELFNLSVKFFVLGLLLNPILINIIGFISPFWAAGVLDDPSRVYYLLDIFQPFAPLVAFVFSYALFSLAKLDDRIGIKILCYFLSTLYIATSLYGFLPEDEVLYMFASNIYSIMECLMLVTAGLIALHISSKGDVSLMLRGITPREE